jgi:hypothetical protein
VLAQFRRELGDAPGRALVTLSDRGLAGAITVTLTHLGFQVDTIDDPVDAARLLDGAPFAVIVTARTAPIPGKEGLFQRLSRLSGDARRRLFVALIGPDLKTGDGTQAFTLVADLVVNDKDAGAADALFQTTLAERARLFHTFIDVKHRHETSGST